MNPKNILATTQAPPLLTDPVKRLLDFHREGGRRRIIALAGYPGSGKTTLTSAWAGEMNRLAGSGVLQVLGMDGFHRYKAELRAMENPEEALARRGAPYTFNPAGLIAKLKEIRNASGAASIGWPGFEHGVGDPVENQIIVGPDSGLILVEGIYTLLREGEWAGLDGLFDESWFLDTPLETAMGRLYRRHQRAWGMSEAEARRRADSNDRLNCANITPGRARADFLVTG